MRLHSRHRVIGRRRLSEAPLARTVRSNDILQVADALRNFGLTALRGRVAPIERRAAAA